MFSAVVEFRICLSSPEGLPLARSLPAVRRGCLAACPPQSGEPGGSQFPTHRISNVFSCSGGNCDSALNQFTSSTDLRQLHLTFGGFEIRGFGSVKRSSESAPACRFSIHSEAGKGGPRFPQGKLRFPRSLWNFRGRCRLSGWFQKHCPEGIPLGHFWDVDGFNDFLVAA